MLQTNLTASLMAPSGFFSSSCWLQCLESSTVTMPEGTTINTMPLEMTHREQKCSEKSLFIQRFMAHRPSTHHRGRSHSLVPRPARTWRLWDLGQPVQSSPGECSQTCPFSPSNSQWPSHLRLWCVCVCPVIDRISTINTSFYNYVDVLIPPPPHTPTHPHVPEDDVHN